MGESQEAGGTTSAGTEWPAERAGMILTPDQRVRAYLEQGQVLVGIYWQRYGWVAPGMEISGLQDELAAARRRSCCSAGESFAGAAAGAVMTAGPG